MRTYDPSDGKIQFLPIFHDGICLILFDIFLLDFGLGYPTRLKLMKLLDKHGEIVRLHRGSRCTYPYLRKSFVNEYWGIVDGVMAITRHKLNSEDLMNELYSATELYFKNKTAPISEEPRQKDLFLTEKELICLKKLAQQATGA
jgi:hypothetical protein